MIQNSAVPNRDHTPIPAGYLTYLARLWVSDDGTRIRGRLEDVHTGEQVSLDLSSLIALVRASLRHLEGGEIDPPTDQPRGAGRT